ncbi:MAG: hypothetical protein LBS01_07500 [Prevotellaceae bacterium]|nr:hypothetical protein [Prevotellaceae bacterium]
MYFKVSYWVVNTVRYQLKQHATNFQWRETVRIMNTQKAVTTVCTPNCVPTPNENL